MPDATTLLTINLTATWYMVGLIWFVQLVHYPQFRSIAADRWAQFHRSHTTLTTVAVAPAMLIELVAAILLLVAQPGAVSIVLLILVILIWLSTAAIQIPMHNLLSHGFNPATHRKLLRSNWIRTILWTTRGLLVAGSTS